MRGRRERRIEALSDGALPARRARRLRESLERDPEGARILRRTQALGRALREACEGVPASPHPEALLARVRPGLARIDRQLAETPAWREALQGVASRAASRLRPALVAGAVGAVLLALTLLWPILPTTPGPGVAHAADITVRSLRQLGTPVMVLRGANGATIIWVFDVADPDLSLGGVAGAWS